MMNKRIPDWLNSALWSAPSPHNDGTSTEPPSPVAPPPAERPPQPPLYSSVDAHDAKRETRDPLSSVVSQNNDGACCSDEEDGRSSANSTASPAAPPAAKDFSRQNQISNELSKKVINMGEIRTLALQGIPDGAGIRAMVWKLLLGYLPADRSLWPPELAKKRSQYNQFKEELLVNPSVRDYKEAGRVKS
ncbi:hypothetical protein C2S53_006426 [Perilla frutescens var. hirtella]|uniref:Uncharacterized protein n=1 Tax=Perilla frutescens var. hirtella TaxID=608512 RepID=A0AAD4JG36_PERFH|nr:hypothetical protein C2S53_006426 [Perilla frutescens var. hirtella]